MLSRAAPGVPMPNTEETPVDLFNPRGCGLALAWAERRAHDIQDISRHSTGWFAVQCRPRFEKVLARWCIAQRIPYFLPYQHTPSGALVPLFEGFLFAANFLEETRTLAQVPYYADYELRRHRHCFGILRTALQEQLKRQLTAIAMTSSAYSLQKMPAGTLVRVQSGPLEGFEGVVVQDNGQLRLVIEVLMLGTLAAVEINREEIAHASASK
jgi:hypothetical protein